MNLAEVIAQARSRLHHPESLTIMESELARHQPTEEDSGSFYMRMSALRSADITATNNLGRSDEVFDYIRQAFEPALSADINDEVGRLLEVVSHLKSEFPDD